MIGCITWCLGGCECLSQSQYTHFPEQTIAYCNWLELWEFIKFTVQTLNAQSSERSTDHQGIVVCSLPQVLWCFRFCLVCFLDDITRHTACTCTILVCCMSGVIVLSLYSHNSYAQKSFNTILLYAHHIKHTVTFINALVWTKIFPCTGNVSVWCNVGSNTNLTAIAAFRDSILRENRMVDRCVRKASLNCDPSHITLDLQPRVIQLGSQWEESTLMHLATIQFSFYAMVLLNLCIQIKYCWKQDFTFCILYVTMWTTLCPNQWSGVYQWVWILPVGLDMKPQCARLPAVSCDLHTTMA